MMPTDLIVEVNGVNLCYNDSGKDGIPIIFIHPFPFNKSAWQDQFDFFKVTNRVIIYDLRGFGGSAMDNKQIDIALLANDLIRLMDKLYIDQAIVVGLSLGGYILLNAVEHYPERFKAIVLCDTQCLADSTENKKKRYESIREIQEKGMDNFAEAFVEKILTEESFTTNKELVEKTKEIILSNSQIGIAGALGAMAERRESCSGLKKLTLPSLILCGKEDVLTPVSLSEFLFTHLPAAKMHAIEKAGHLSNLEQPDEFNRHLDEFIKNLN